MDRKMADFRFLKSTKIGFFVFSRKSDLDQKSPKSVHISTISQKRPLLTDFSKNSRDYQKSSENLWFSLTLVP